MQKFKNVDELVRRLRPEKPVYCIRGESVAKASVFFPNTSAISRP